MVRYDKKTIFNYVTGADLDNYNIDELENDFNFMKDVIIYTGDKNMYNFCSDELKQDPEFVQLIVDKFSSDHEFVLYTVIDNYRKLATEPLKQIEFKIFLYKLTKKYDFENSYKLDYSKKRDSDTLAFSKLSAATIVEETKRQMEEFVELTKNDKDISYGSKNGFVFLEDTFDDNKIILDFFAEIMINDCFDSKSEEKQRKIFRLINSLGEDELENIDYYIIKYIENYDLCLADYVKKNTSVLKSIKKDFEYVIRNKDSIRNQIEEDLYFTIYEKVDEYMEENSQSISFFINQVVDYVVNEFGLKEMFERQEELHKQDIEDDFHYYSRNFDMRSSLTKPDKNEFAINYESAEEDYSKNTEIENDDLDLLLDDDDEEDIDFDPKKLDICDYSHYLVIKRIIKDCIKNKYYKKKDNYCEEESDSKIYFLNRK